MRPKVAKRIDRARAQISLQSFSDVKERSDAHTLAAARIIAKQVANFCTLVEIFWEGEAPAVPPLETEPIQRRKLSVVAKCSESL
jgi:hypothetical protein